MPVVSALLVFHRDTPYLRPAIASLLAQSWPDLEVVLVDNGTAITAEALGPCGRDPRIRWVRLTSNEGIPAGHNAGVRAARGDYIALLDYDDIALPNRIERQIELLGAKPDLGLVSSLAETINEDGKVQGREFALIDAAAQRLYTQFAAPVVTPTYTGRREVFERLPYRREFPLTADFDFLARATEIWPMAGVPDVLIQYRRYQTQTTEAKATEIEFSRGAIRLLTARRRKGESEQLDDVVRTACPCRSPANACLFWAKESIRQRFRVLAAFHARRALALGGVPAEAMALGFRAIREAPPAERAMTIRLFLRGPVRALRLAPA